MPCGIICGRITPARGNLEHRPLSGAVMDPCSQNKQRIVNFNCVSVFHWIMHRSWSEWDGGSGYNCRARIDVYRDRGVRNIFVLDIHYHNTHHTTQCTSWSDCYCQEFLSTDDWILWTEWCMGLHQINTSHASITIVEGGWQCKWWCGWCLDRAGGI